MPDKGGESKDCDGSAFKHFNLAEICRKYNVASSALYRWRDEFIAGGTAAMDHGRSTVEASFLKEINELKGIIGELTIANETLKKIQATRRGGKP
ncbi:MAG: helix-turn-helix domain-containing protein [Thermoplasmataceae archaeon]